MSQFWAKMIGLYGYKWTSQMGDVLDGNHLSITAKTWREGLAGLTRKQIGKGFSALLEKTLEWPPSLPEFRRLCIGQYDAPSIDEIVSILAVVGNLIGPLSVRYRHPLALAIARHPETDMPALRIARYGEGRKLIKPVYDFYLQVGWPDWPEGAHEEQVVLVHDKPKANKDIVRAAFAAIKRKLA
jgi:hypothetical protein